jgi:cytochrome P450
MMKKFGNRLEGILPNRTMHQAARQHLFPPGARVVQNVAMSAQASIETARRVPEAGDILLAPPPPEDAHFDSALDGWVLSKYADVLAALREPALLQTGAPDGVQNVRRPELLAQFSGSRLAAWRASAESLTKPALQRLPSGRTVDLVSEFLRPWSLRLATGAVRASPVQRWRVTASAPYASGGQGSLPLGRFWSGVLRKAAGWDLDRFFRHRPPEAKSMFLGISQTLPSFLANVWLALLRSPSTMEALRAEPFLIPKAVEETLRYAGLVHTLVRTASENVILGGAAIAIGDRVILKLASANRDPRQFDEPGRLNITRRSVSHLGFGAGPHSCVGASLVRAAAEIATRSLLDTFASIEVCGPVPWNCGSTLCFPASLLVMLQR